MTKSPLLDEDEFYHQFNKSLQSDAIKTAKPSVFWKKITIEQEQTGWAIYADERNIKTPKKKPLIAPNKDSAMLIAHEWQAQTDYIRPMLMPLSRLAMTIIDILEGDDNKRQDWLNAAFSYVETDLLLFPSSYPQSLQAAENTLWQPLLNWAQQRLNFNFKANDGLAINPHNKKAAKLLAQIVETGDIWQQMTFVNLCQACGSAILALASMEKAIDSENLTKAALVQEQHQLEQWGDDAELFAQIENKKFAFASYHRFLQSFS